MRLGLRISSFHDRPVYMCGNVETKRDIETLTSDLLNFTSGTYASGLKRMLNAKM